MVKQAMQVYAGKITKLNCLKLFGNKPCNTFKKCLLLVNIYQLYSTYNIIYIYIYSKQFFKFSISYVWLHAATIMKLY